MAIHRRAVLLVSGLLALGLVGLLRSGSARADELAGKGGAPETWVYDVRVVRVDPADAAVLESPPAWQPAGPSGATTAAPWSELLAGLKARGRTTILLDQRVTAVSGMPAEWSQVRIRPVTVLERKDQNNQTWRAGTVETGSKGSILATPALLQYTVDARWAYAADDGAVPQGMTLWKGSHPHLAAGSTLVLPYRQQVPGAEASEALEIYVLLTGWPVPAK